MPELKASMSELKPLVFEHLVQINDEINPLIEPLTRLQLWRGLILRAEQPKLFTPWLESFELFPQTNGRLQRRLKFPQFSVEDQVSFKEGESLDFEVLNGADGLESKLTIRIEEPTTESLFLRFSYTVISENHHQDSPLKGAITEAYRHADQDTVFRIRQLAESGILDQ